MRNYYYNQNWQVVEETTAAEGLPGTTAYVWGLRGVDSAVCRIVEAHLDGEETVPAETLYYMSDAHGNVMGLVSAGGSVVERYSYDAGGVVTFMAGDWTVVGASAYGNEILYSGYRYDAEVAGYQVRHREYLPGMGVWMQRDALGYVDGMNDLEYVRGGVARMTFVARGEGVNLGQDGTSVGEVRAPFQGWAFLRGDFSRGSLRSPLAIDEAPFQGWGRWDVWE